MARHHDSISCLKSGNGSASECKSSSREFEPRPSHITFVEIDHEIISSHFLTYSRRAVVS